MNASIINISELSLQISGNRILEDISLSVPRGGYISIIGPNGAGKTSLLKCLNGIITDWEGTITVNDISIRECSQKKLARMVGYVPQFSRPSLPFSVREFLLMSRYPYQNALTPPNNRDFEAVQEALTATDSLKFANRQITTLSGGECQKVFIAAALAQQTDILLLDEPTVFLDPRYRIEISHLIRKVNREKETTVIHVSHELNNAIRNSDRILALKNGKIMMYESAEKMTEKGVMERIFDTSFVFATHPQTGDPIIVPEDNP